MTRAELAHFLAYLPYSRSLYRNGGWKHAPDSADFWPWLRNFFPRTVLDRARSASQALAATWPGRPEGNGATASSAPVGCGFLLIWDAQYPDSLKNIFDPPPVLYYQGPLAFLQSVRSGIVGTRRPHPLAVLATRTLVESLVPQGASIVSGFARGIDRVAHEAAQDLGLPTIAVLGSGTLQAGPASNRFLLERPILLLSEYPPTMSAYAGHFPRRNRIIAGLVPALAVMQAPEGSGALISADFALEEGREVFFFDDERLPAAANAGSRRLLAEGGRRLFLVGSTLRAGTAKREEQLQFWEKQSQGQLCWIGGNEYALTVGNRIEEE